MVSPSPFFPTGAQYSISGGGHTAVVCEVGATLRVLQRDGVDLVKGFGAEEPVDQSCRGQQLLPWPNRIRDGRWPWQGETQQLPISEVPRATAIHGLVRWLPWELVDHREDHVTQRVVLRPQHGWPATMEALLTHRVDRDGLTVDLLVANPSEEDLPFGYGAHPYLTVGEDDVNEVELTSPATRELVVEPDRLLPVRLADVPADHDLRTGRLLAGIDLDTAFTGLEPTDGRWTVRLRHGSRSTELWADAAFGWLQVFTGGGQTDWGVAVEPMTCGPDAFNPGPTHADLVVLRPGQRFAGSWGIRGTV